MLVATLGKIPLFLFCSLSLSGSSSSPVLGDAMPLSRQSPETNTGLQLSLVKNSAFPNTPETQAALKGGRLNKAPQGGGPDF